MENVHRGHLADEGGGAPSAVASMTRILVIAEDPWVRAGLSQSFAALARDDLALTAIAPQAVGSCACDVAVVWPRAMHGPDWYAASAALGALRTQMPGAIRAAVTERTISAVRTLRLVEEGAQFLIPEDDLKGPRPVVAQVAASLVKGDFDGEYAAPEPRALRNRLGLRRGDLVAFLDLVAGVPAELWTYRGPLAQSGLTRRAQEHVRRAAMDLGGLQPPELVNAGPRPAPTLPRFTAVAALVRDAWGLDD